MSNLEDLNEIVKNSGNNFHCKVKNYFEIKGWETLVSPYYMDNATNKPREIDLIVEKSWQSCSKFGAPKGAINVKLFIECKYIPQTNVFWFDTKDFTSAREWLATNTPLKDNNDCTNRHHYISSNEKVAKLFASKPKSNSENEVIYKALNQSLNAMLYLRHKKSIIPNNPQDRYKGESVTVELPVILCNSFDKFFRVDMDGSEKPVKIDDNFQLEVNYAYVNSRSIAASEYFLIDIVKFDLLDNYLEIIDFDVDTINDITKYET